MRRGNRKISALTIDKILVILFGAIMTLTVFGSIYNRYGEYAFGGLIFTALFWSMIEVLISASNHWIHAIWRFIVAFILGSIFGGVFTYYTQFGYYIIEPALAGNFVAVFSLAGVIVFTLVVTWNAVWSHNKTYVKR